jgi:hypothetical protein
MTVPMAITAFSSKDIESRRHEEPQRRHAHDAELQLRQPVRRLRTQRPFDQLAGVPRPRTSRATPA